MASRKPTSCARAWTRPPSDRRPPWREASALSSPDSRSRGTSVSRSPPAPPVFADRFRFLRELGRGGVGVAWLCEDTMTSDMVVVKHAWNWTGPLAERDARIRAEGDVLARLDHPAITRLHARFDLDGRHHLARSYAAGEDLARAVARNGPIADRRALLMRIANALDHMHARGLLCLDVNPANFVLKPDGAIVLADLGHARSADAPLADARWGMQGYTAPDVATAYGPTADVFGLGALAYFLATGKAYDPKRALPSGDLADAAFLRACLAPAETRPATIRDALRLLA